MSETKHTPGQWYVGHDLVNPITGRPGLSVGTVGLTIAAVDTSEADARLIAAAPELLDVLQDMTDFIASGTPIDKDSNIIEQARAAIAKAKGGRS